MTSAELPVLREHGLSMWGYVVLGALADGPVRTQAALADAIGADRSRIIPVLDELQRSDLIQREPDPRDRRVRVLSVTPEGRRRVEAARKGIRRREDRLLARLDAASRVTFLRALAILADVSADEISGERDPR